VTTLREALVDARDRLRAAGIEDAQIEAELLLRYALEEGSPADGRTARPSSASGRAAWGEGAPDRSARTTGRAVSRAELFTRFDDPVADDTAQIFEACIARRLAREPNAYITWRKEFRGLELCVAPAVLIPRPETEALVDVALRELSELSQRDVAPAHPSRATGRAESRDRPSRASGRAGPSAAPPRIVDVGTGSGAVAVALAKELPEAEIYATDVSREALDVAATNARRHGVERSIAFRRGHLLEPISRYVDCIVANLPYVTTAEWQQLPPELRDHEPRLALDGGRDGLDLIRALLHQAPRYLRRGGFVALEIGGDRQAEALSSCLTASMPGARWRVEKDFANIPRILTVRLSNG
jgi:release factor glutamine methyltransferase